MITRISKIKPLSVVVADKGHDSEDNHVMVREKLKVFSVISSRHEKDVPISKTRGKYRKEMKRGYSKILYNQRNKDETIVSVIKKIVWRTYIIQINTNAEQRIDFQMYLHTIFIGC